MKRLNDWTKELLFGVINFVCIVLLCCFLFARFGGKNETNTYTFYSTISNLRNESTTNADWICFDTNEGKAYYKFFYSHRFSKARIDEDRAKFERLAESGVTVKLIETDDIDLIGPDRSYKKIIAISTADEVIFSLEYQNAVELYTRNIALSMLAIYAIISALVFFFPYNSWMLKIKRSIRKRKKKRKKLEMRRRAAEKAEIDSIGKKN